MPVCTALKTTPWRTRNFCACALYKLIIYITLLYIGLQSIFDYTEQSQLSWYGHVKGMADGRTTQRWLNWTPLRRQYDHVDVLDNAGWITSSKLWRDEELPCTTLSRRSCSSTEENGDTSSWYMYLLT